MTKRRATIDRTSTASNTYSLMKKSVRGLAKKAADVAALCHIFHCAKAASCIISKRTYDAQKQLTSTCRENYKHIFLLSLLLSKNEVASKRRTKTKTKIVDEVALQCRQDRRFPAGH